MSDEKIAKSDPKRIGKYHIDSVLGEGAMGVVYKAHDPDINRPVAIKTVRDVGDSPELRSEFHERFKREAQAAGRLSHPNIVGVYDFGVDDGVNYLVMEYIEGGSLSAAMNEKAKEWPPRETIAVVLDVLAGLGHAHAKGVVHRDIKPGNILLASDGGVKLADFGVARLEGSGITQVGQVIGTPSYMAPEQVQGREATAASDLYAVGIILYELLCREKPFSGTSLSVMQKIVNQAPIKPSLLNIECPAWLDAVVTKAIDKIAANRFQSADEFAEALRQGEASATPPADASSDATVVARPSVETAADTSLAVELPVEPTRVEPVGRTNGRRRRRLVAVALVVLVSGIALTFAALDEIEARREQAAWADAERLDSIDGYGAYLNTYPDGEHVDLAGRRLADLERDVLRQAAEREAWLEAERLDTAAGYRAYLDAFPDSEQVPLAGRRLADLERGLLRQTAEQEAWLEAERLGTAAGYRAYLDAFPDGEQAPAAGRRLADLESGLLRQAAERVAGRFSCAHIGVLIDDAGSVTVSGFTASQQDADALLAALAGLAGVTDVVSRLSVQPWPICQAMSIIHRLGAPGGDGMQIELNNADGVYRQGQPVMFRVTTGDHGGYLYVDYFDIDGGVVRLFPTELRPDNLVGPGETVVLGQGPGQTDPGARRYTAGTPFGPSVVTAVVTSEPLSDATPVGVDAAASYFEWLERSLFGGGGGGGRGSAVGHYRSMIVGPSAEP